MWEKVATRELRSNLAAHLRRAAAGHHIVVTAGGRAIATLGPLHSGTASAPTLDALVAAGQLTPARRPGVARPTGAMPVWSGIRLDRALRELRG